MPCRAWLRALVISVAGLVAGARPALAQPTPAEKQAAAQALFDTGRKLAAQGKHAEACPKLLESNTLDPAIGTKFYLADCYEHTGKLASAWTYYLDVADEARRIKSADREKLAGERASALEQRLPRLLVTLGGARDASGLVIRRDGIVVGAGSLDTALPIDLGDHTISASAPGMKTWESRLQVTQEGKTITVEIPALESEPVAPPKVEPDKPPPRPPVVPDAPAPPPSSGQKIAGFAVGGVGLAALVAGAGLGGLAMSRKSASNEPGACDTSDVCTPAGHDLRVSAIHAATASTTLFVVGGAALAGGGVLLFTAPRGAPQQPQVSFGPGSLVIRGRF